MHDVGKIGVPDAVLFKAGPLTKTEYEQVVSHASLGAQIVSGALSEEQGTWVRGHHERWDGAGYPDGLAGDEIPEGARILALADSWDVMTVARNYSRRARWSTPPGNASASRAASSGPRRSTAFLGMIESGDVVIPTGDDPTAPDTSALIRGPAGALRVVDIRRNAYRGGTTERRWSYCIAPVEVAVARGATPVAL